LVVITRGNGLVLWSCHPTGRFPRGHTLIQARYRRERQALLGQANLTLEVLRFPMRLAKNRQCLKVTSYAHAAKAIDEIGRLEEPLQAMKRVG
jgi:hypothetical protein